MVETTTTATLNQEQQNGSDNNDSILKLRSSANNNSEHEQHQVRFVEGTVDNENMNKKKTKICCIYHPDDEGDEADTCEHDYHKENGSAEAEDSSSDEEDDGLSYEQRRAKRIERRKKQLIEQDKTGYVPANSYEVQPDYNSKKQAQ